MSEGSLTPDDGSPGPTWSVVTERLDDDAAVTRVRGEFDLASRRGVERELSRVLHTSPSALAIDLSTTTFISSSGMIVLLSCYKQAADMGVRLGVAVPPGRVLRRLELAGVVALLNIQPTVDQALAICRSPLP